MALPWLPSQALPVSRNACDGIHVAQNGLAPPLRSALAGCRAQPPPKRRYIKVRAARRRAEPGPGLFSVGRGDSHRILSEREQFLCSRTVMVQVGTERDGLRRMASSRGD